jgi:hypothetical protein
MKIRSGRNAPVQNNSGSKFRDHQQIADHQQIQQYCVADQIILFSS